VPLSRWPKR